MPAVLDNLPQANVRDPRKGFDRAKYVRVDNVPVFAEHVTRDNEGRTLRFGPAELKQLADSCNRRIQANGDYAAVIVGHTSSKTDAVQRHPEVIGYAGPFLLGVQGFGAAKKYVILATFWIRRDRVAIYNAYPRRSAELWIQGANSFLDPIALLGGDPPRLDMGLAPEIPVQGHDGAAADGSRFFLALNAAGQRCLKYSVASMPSAGTGLRSASMIGRTPRNAKPGQKKCIQCSAAAADASASPQPRGNTMALTPEDIKQLVEAVLATEPMQYVLRKMEEETADNAEGLGELGDLPTDQDDALPPEELGAGEPEPVAPETSAAPIEPAAPAAPPAAPASQAAPSGDAAEPPKPVRDEKDEPAKFSRLEARIRELEDERAGRVDAERLARLQQLSHYRLFDVGKAMERVRYSKKSDAEFAEFCEEIVENYQPTGVGSPMPFPTALLGSTAVAPPAGPEKYDRKTVDKAVKYCKDQAAMGRQVNYEEVLEKVANGQPL